MACLEFSFKREVKVYLVNRVGLTYIRLDISEINFSQVIQESSYSNKSIQNKNYFEQSVINTANPANFDIILPAIRESDFKAIFNKALDYTEFDLFIETAMGNFSITTCVIASLNFVVEKARPLTMSLMGEAGKLEMVTTSVPGTEIPRSSTMTYNRITDLSIDLVGTFSLTSAAVSVTIELQNEVNWTPYTTVHDAHSGTTMYPKAYTVRQRILSGSFTKYIIDTETSDVLSWSANAVLKISAGQVSGAIFYGFDFDIANCSFTNRLGTGEVFTQSYDWRMTDNNAIDSIITYHTF